MAHPDMLIHPGEILLEEFLRPYRLTPSSLAKRLDMAPNRITQIVNGERSITPDTAILFSATFGTSAEFWLNLQRHYDLERAHGEVSAERMERARALHQELEAT